MEDSDLVFDRVLHSVGEDGKFQRRYNIAFNFLLSLVSTMVYMNYIMIMVAPDHWCVVPGRNTTNFTIEEWKEMYLPRNKNINGLDVYSSCEMYNSNLNETTDCLYGYEYNNTWYDNTLASTENWVCEKELYIANTLAGAKLSEVFGGMILGYLGDIIGRRPVHIIALSLMVSGRIGMVFLKNWFIPFLISTLIASLPSTIICQSLLVMIMEISPPENRAFVGLLQHTGWTIGMCLLPLVYWLARDWKIYLLATTAPATIYFFTIIFLIESPRWLLTRGRVAECLKQLQTIAKVNGTRLSPDSALMLQNSSVAPEKVYGILSLFSSWRISKNTTMFICLWLACVINYYTLMLNLANLSGNPYLNFFLQAIPEIPAYLLARLLCDQIGRRYTGIFGYTLGVISYIILIFTIRDSENTWLHISMVALAKFATCMTYFVLIIQGLEIFPTCVRQSANSLGMTVGNLFTILSPYIVHVGSVKYVMLPFIILLALTLIGLIAEVFLPETLHERLPETMHEARSFGKDQVYFNFPRKKSDVYVLAHLRMMRRQCSEKDENDN